MKRGSPGAATDKIPRTERFPPNVLPLTPVALLTAAAPIRLIPASRQRAARLIPAGLAAYMHRFHANNYICRSDILRPSNQKKCKNLENGAESR